MSAEKFGFFIRFENEYKAISPVEGTIECIRKEIRGVLSTLDSNSDFDLYLKITEQSQIPESGSILHVKKKGDSPCRRLDSPQIQESPKEEMVMPIKLEYEPEFSVFGGSNGQCSSVDAALLNSACPDVNNVGKHVDYSNDELSESEMLEGVDFLSPAYGISREWPERFPIPVDRFPPRLRLALSNGNLPSNLERQLLNHLYTAITFYKFYLTPSEFRSVASSLLEHYPGLAVGIDRSTALRYWCCKLSNKMRNARRHLDSEVPVVIANKEKRNNYKNAARAIIKGEPASTFTRSIPRKHLLNAPIHYTSDASIVNESSISNFKTYMIEEMKKEFPDKESLANAMNLTFTERHKYITESGPSVADIRLNYPILFDFDQILCEFHRVTGVWIISEMENYLSENALKICSIQQENLEQKSLSDEEYLEIFQFNLTPAEINKKAMLWIPDLLHDEAKFTCNYDREVKSPMLVEDSSTSQYKLFIESELVCEGSSLLDGIAVLFASFHIFNIAYTANLKKSLIFIQKIMLKLHDKMKSPLTITKLERMINIRM